MKVLPAVLCLIIACPALAGMVEVVNVSATHGAAGWRFEVMLLHADNGDDDFTSAWQIAAPDGTVLATQVVAAEADKARRRVYVMSRVQIPEDVAVVVISAHDPAHGWGAGYPYTLPLR